MKTTKVLLKPCTHIYSKVIVECACADAMDYAASSRNTFTSASSVRKKYCTWAAPAILKSSGLLSDRYAMNFAHAQPTVISDAILMEFAHYLNVCES